jgi:hypothetical protein
MYQYSQLILLRSAAAVITAVNDCGLAVTNAAVLPAAAAMRRHDNSGSVYVATGRGICLSSTLLSVLVCVPGEGGRGAVEDILQGDN